MTKYCKECGREEIGYGSILDEDGYCPNCAVRHNDKKIKELKQELRLRIEENEAMYNELCKKAQQLKEANEVILGLHKPYETSLEPATLYLDKWGVK